MTSSKINILINPHVESTPFSSNWLTPLLGNYFNIVHFDSTLAYDKNNTILVVDIIKINKFSDHFWYRSYLDQGFKIVAHASWEPVEDYCTLMPDFQQCFVLHSKNWFWYHESLLHTHLGYQNYRPNKTYTKLALMPIRVDRWHRKETFVRMSSMLDDMIWSYASYGKCLPNDMPLDHVNFHRYYNHAWYDSTYYSLVTETEVDTSPGIFVTEKTFKPMAFYHPFMCVAQPGHLAYLKSRGFETFENMFDESYDLMPEIYDRIEHVVSQSMSFKKQPYSKLTCDKLAHNHARFYNRQLVESLLISELIEPILEYAES
jgi:hypothetical protein